jgi:hypothetical protein
MASGDDDFSPAVFASWIASADYRLFIFAGPFPSTVPGFTPAVIATERLAIFLDGPASLDVFQVVPEHRLAQA